MAALLFIPSNDPFAVFGIMLLFALIIVFVILLTFMARKSAQEARKAVHDQARFQRLIQTQQREERLFQALKHSRTKGKGKARADVAPTLTFTSPSTSSSLRTTDERGSRALNNSTAIYDVDTASLRTPDGRGPGPSNSSTARDKAALLQQDRSSSSRRDIKTSTNLRGIRTNPSPTKSHFGQLPSTLRVVQQATKHQQGAIY